MTSWTLPPSVGKLPSLTLQSFFHSSLPSFADAATSRGRLGPAKNRASSLHFRYAVEANPSSQCCAPLVVPMASSRSLDEFFQMTLPFLASRQARCFPSQV